MTHEFEVRHEIELDATPEQVWEAIATGPGMDSWFMGRSEVGTGEGLRGAFEMHGHTEGTTTTAWEPGKRLAYRGDGNPDGTFMAFEYLIEGREGGSTVLRFVHNGFLGDDWEAEYDALAKGDWMYLKKLAAYLKHFPGRTSSFSLLTAGAQTQDKDRVWDAFRTALGVTGTAVAEGDRVRLSVDGIPEAGGTVASTDGEEYVTVCTADSLYVLAHGHQDMVFLSHHCFDAGQDAEATEAAWQTWLAGAFA